MNQTKNRQSHKQDAQNMQVLPTRGEPKEQYTFLAASFLTLFSLQPTVVPAAPLTHQWTYTRRLLPVQQAQGGKLLQGCFQILPVISLNLALWRTHVHSPGWPLRPIARSPSEEEDRNSGIRARVATWPTWRATAHAWCSRSRHRGVGASPWPCQHARPSTLALIEHRTLVPLLQPSNT